MKCNWLFFWFLWSCGGSKAPTTPPSSIFGEKGILKEPIQTPLLEEPRYVGGGYEEWFLPSMEKSSKDWTIPLSAYRCRGSSWNRSDKGRQDCLGGHAMDVEVDPRIRGFLDYFQKEYQRRLRVLIGVRCHQHESYIQAKESYTNGERVIVRLEGVNRQLLKGMMEKLCPSAWQVEIKIQGFLLEDRDLWGESQTVQVALKKGFDESIRMRP